MNEQEKNCVEVSLIFAMPLTSRGEKKNSVSSLEQKNPMHSSTCEGRGGVKLSKELRVMRIVRFLAMIWQLANLF